MDRIVNPNELSADLQKRVKDRYPELRKFFITEAEDSSTK